MMDKQQNPPPRMGMMPKIALLLISLGGVVVLRQGFLLPLIGLLPSIVAYITDRTSSRALFHTVMACNLSGVFYYLLKLIYVHHNESHAMQEMLQNGNSWLVMYGSAGAGYMLYFVMPYFSFFFLRMVNGGKLMRLNGIQEKLLRDWGPTIAETQDEGKM